MMNGMESCMGGAMMAGMAGLGLLFATVLVLAAVALAKYIFRGGRGGG